MAPARHRRPLCGRCGEPRPRHRRGCLPLRRRDDARARQLVGEGDPGKLSLTGQTYMGRYGTVERWAMKRYGGTESDGTFYPRIYGRDAKKVYDFFYRAVERVILETVMPGSAIDDKSVTDILTSSFNKMPKGSESILGKFNALEMKWRPYWESTDANVHGPLIEYWRVMRDAASWSDIWRPSGHRVKALTLPIVLVPKKKKKKPGTFADANMILALAVIWYLSQRKKSR